MSKELPFFKFDPTEWLIGRISFQPVDVQGAFTQACCMYWKLGGKMKDTDINFRIGDDYLQKLKQLGFIKESEGMLHISFLDNQFEECEKMREHLRRIGKNGGLKKAVASASETLPDATKNEASATKILAEPSGTLLSKSKSKNKEERKKKEELKLPFSSEGFKVAWELWKEYKSKEHNFKYKSQDSETAALEDLFVLSEKNEFSAIQILKKSMSKGWKGFFALKEEDKKIIKMAPEPMTRREVDLMFGDI